MAANGYFIKQGVRRSLAAWTAGHVDIAAWLEILGSSDLLIRVRLDELYSPKAVVLRDSRYIRDVEYPTHVLRTAPPPINIEPLGYYGQPRRPTHLPQVRLV